VEGLCSYTDRFLICHGRSTKQVQAIAQNVKETLKKEYGVAPLGVEGMSDGRWVILDYGEAVVHIFYEPLREYYDLEGIWPDAKKIEVQ